MPKYLELNTLELHDAVFSAAKELLDLPVDVKAKTSSDQFYLVI